MRLRKSISLQKEDYEALRPLIKENNGNFSKAIRELIRSNHIGKKLNPRGRPLSPDEVWDNKRELRDKLIEEKLFCLIPLDLLGCWIRVVAGMIPPLGYYRFLFDRVFPDLIGIKNIDIKTYSKYVNIITYLTGGWGRQSIMPDPEDPNRAKIRIEMSKGQVEPIAALATYISAHEPLRLKPVGVTRSPTFIDVECVVAGSEEEAYEGVVEHFGFNQDIYVGIQSDPDYWRGVFKMAKLYDNSLVIFGLQDFLKIQTGHSNETAVLMLERILGKGITEVPLKELLAAIEMTGRINGMIKKIDVKEEKIKIYLTFHDQHFAQKISSCILNILKNAGHIFMLKKVYDDWCILTPRS
jgi:hypothetical protein